MVTDGRFGTPPVHFFKGDDAEELEEGEQQIPLGPALIACAVLVSLGAILAAVVWAIHKFIVPIPF